MGVSTDAVVFFGYCWTEEMDLLDGDSEWDKSIAVKRGHKNPWDGYPTSEEPHDYEKRRSFQDAWCKQHRSELDDWHRACGAIEEEFGCDIGYHCSCECSMTCVFVKESEVTAHRGCPVDLSEALGEGEFDGRPDWAGWKGMLDAFLVELGLEKPEGQEEPRWWMVSYWG